MYLNKAIVIGNLTRDPEVKSLPSGIQVATFSLATNRVWKDKNGVKQENVDYHNVVVFGRQAETVGQYLKKGSSALVEGRMQTRSWEGQDGVKKYRTEIVVENMIMLEGPRGTSTPGGSGMATSNTSGGDMMPPPEAPKDEEIKVEDIPF